MTEYNMEELVKKVDTKWLLYLEKIINKELGIRYGTQKEELQNENSNK